MGPRALCPTQTPRFLWHAKCGALRQQPCAINLVPTSWGVSEPSSDQCIRLLRVMRPLRTCCREASLDCRNAASAALAESGADTRAGLTCPAAAAAAGIGASIPGAESVARSAGAGTVNFAKRVVGDSWCFGGGEGTIASRRCSVCAAACCRLNASHALYVSGRSIRVYSIRGEVTPHSETCPWKAGFTSGCQPELQHSLQLFK